MKVVLIYIPVLHEGYRIFLEKHKDADQILVWGQEITEKFSHLSKEIRQLNHELVVKTLIKSWGYKNTKLLTESTLATLDDKYEVVMPNDDISRELAKEIKSSKIIFDDIFLRWDKHNSVKPKPIDADRKISSEEFDKEMMIKSMTEAEKSSDWWRQVGSVIVKDGEVISLTHNTHVPSEYMPYVNGDPRNNFHKGVNIESSSAIHAEALAIAKSAQKGVSLDGSSIYVSVFPCPPCAKLIAYSGIKKIYYHQGYGVLDGEGILKSQGVEIIFVDL